VRLPQFGQAAMVGKSGSGLVAIGFSRFKSKTF
jgi:hypothetical protein